MCVSWDLSIQPSHYELSALLVELLELKSASVICYLPSQGWDDKQHWEECDQHNRVCGPSHRKHQKGSSVSVQRPAGKTIPQTHTEHHTWFLTWLFLCIKLHVLCACLAWKHRMPLRSCPACGLVALTSPEKGPSLILLCRKGGAVCLTVSNSMCVCLLLKLHICTYVK